MLNKSYFIVKNKPVARASVAKSEEKPAKYHANSTVSLL